MDLLLFLLMEKLELKDIHENVNYFSPTDKFKLKNWNLQQKFITSCISGDQEAVKELIMKIDPSFGDNVSLYRACQYHNIEIVKILLKDKRIDPSLSSYFCLRWACEFGYLDVVKELIINRGIDPSVGKNRMIMISCLYGKDEIVKFLLQYPQVNPCEQNNYCLRIAMEKNHQGVLEVLRNDSRIIESNHDISNHLSTFFKKTSWDTKPLSKL